MKIVELRRILTLLIPALAGLAMGAPQASAQLATCAAVDDFYAPSDLIYNYNYCNSEGPTAAQVRSQTDIANDQQSQQIARALQGSHSPGLLAIFPSGRWMQSHHDGLELEGANFTTGEIDSNEFSAFLNASYDVPGVVFGGQLKINGIVGGLHLKAEQDARGGFFATKSDNDSFFIGVGNVWSQGSFYTSSTFIYFTGETEARFTDGAGGTGEVESDTDGYVSNSVVGNVFDLPGIMDNLKFDLRGAIGNAKGNDDLNGPQGTNLDARSTELTVWHGTLSGMFFMIIPSADGGVSRPYLQLSYKHQFEYDNEVNFTVAGQSITQTFDQARDYGRIDVGFDHVSGAWTFGSALYVEGSEDEGVVGGRVGVSYKFSSGE